MKVMSVGQFISERIKIKPVTNAELKNTCKQIEQVKKMMFDKKKLFSEIIQLVTSCEVEDIYIKPNNAIKEIRNYCKKFEPCSKKIASKNGMHILRYEVKVTHYPWSEFDPGMEARYIYVAVDYDKNKDNVLTLCGSEAEWTLEDCCPGEVWVTTDSFDFNKINIKSQK